MSSNQLIFKLDEADQEVFFEALFDQEVTPNMALATAAGRYNQLLKRP